MPIFNSEQAAQELSKFEKGNKSASQYEQVHPNLLKDSWLIKDVSVPKTNPKTGKVEEVKTTCVNGGSWGNIFKLPLNGKAKIIFLDEIKVSDEILVHVTQATGHYEKGKPMTGFSVVSNRTWDSSKPCQVVDHLQGSPKYKNVYTDMYRLSTVLVDQPIVVLDKAKQAKGETAYKILSMFSKQILVTKKVDMKILSVQLKEAFGYEDDTPIRDLPLVRGFCLSLARGGDQMSPKNGSLVSSKVLTEEQIQSLNNKNDIVDDYQKVLHGAGTLTTAIDFDALFKPMSIDELRLLPDMGDLKGRPTAQTPIIDMEFDDGIHF